MMHRPWRVGVDTGGTFTDGILWNEEDGRIVTAKLLSTPDDPGRAVSATVARLIGNGNAVDPQAVSYLVHGTTVATNAVLQRRLAPAAFVTTRGFRDVLEIARQVRENAFDVFFEKPPSLVPRHFCFEVTERLDGAGEVVVALDLDSVEKVAAELAQTGVKAVAVCLLHAYRNPAHERNVGELLRARLPGVAVSLSSDLSSEFREFQRACTTIINAGLVPEVGRYLHRLDAALAGCGLAGSRLVMQSNGGVSEFIESAERPVFLIESGPAAGVVGAAHFANSLGEPDIISFDMGGTTAKVGLVQDGVPYRVQEFEIGVSSNRARRWNAGAAGYPILTPAVDLIEIGTGGGSLAWVDDGGKLRVGPMSAGAEPGPACYGRGGTAPTITDANLALGRINPDFFLGGEMQLDVDASHRAIESLAGKLGLERLAIAAGIVQIADAAMAQALRVVSVQRGYDPAQFRLVAFGGAGPLHALAVAAETGIASVLVPPRPGVASALGLLVADLKHDFALTLVQRTDRVDFTALEESLNRLAAQGREPLRREGIAETAMRFERALDLRYVGQSYHLTIVLPNQPVTRELLDDARRRFNEAHFAAYGYAEPGEPCEVVNVRVSAIGTIRSSAPDFDPSSTSTVVEKDPRQVWFESTGFAPCAVYDRSTLARGASLHGPAVIEDRDATTLVHPGWRCSVVQHGALRIDRR
jgi:N-methylhydantoinase A